MTEVTSELIYEILKNIQFRIDKIETGVDELRAGQNAIRGHMLSMQNDTNNIYSILGRHDVRFDRIERRLELRELAEQPQRPYEPPQT